MIISRIIGGLGNQMFQYAAGRSLALRLDVPLLLDTRGFVGYGLHQGFELGRVFSVQAGIATASDLDRVLGWQAGELPLRMLGRRELSWLRRRGLFVEPHFEYCEAFGAIGPSSYLKGYWQSERYFIEHEAAIRADFAFRQPLTGKNRDIADRIEGSEAVSLHVRRGDYVSNSANASIFAACSPAYYEAAIRKISERISDPQFFVFSDDLEWARANIRLPQGCHFIAHNSGSASFNDLRLMTLCRHNIIANSSFSWWGAWLNTSQGRIVVAPANWFVDGRSDSDLIPAGWLKL